MNYDIGPTEDLDHDQDLNKNEDASPEQEKLAPPPEKKGVLLEFDDDCGQTMKDENQRKFE